MNHNSINERNEKAAELFKGNRIKHLFKTYNLERQYEEMADDFITIFQVFCIEPEPFLEQIYTNLLEELKLATAFANEIDNYFLTGLNNAKMKITLELDNGEKESVTISEITSIYGILEYIRNYWLNVNQNKTSNLKSENKIEHLKKYYKSVYEMIKSDKDTRVKLSLLISHLSFTLNEYTELKSLTKSLNKKQSEFIYEFLQLMDVTRLNFDVEVGGKYIRDIVRHRRDNLNKKYKQNE